ncbi:putative methyltransferase DDB_G0268948 isoform X1 [Physella acuta]|uniref:putative methyltransferase DDB_G0268948 isoform X1 n=1 Tax=Physella acuta TaxID=109671 RepID=UPI0027DB44CC|nr:putative methyltransferase DDB_G0268948 isoform X1 [Physella acuta]XP_059175904.1 putative methyltransferase DDB_G0268948 isoform X1 [Physella acuta]
MEKWPELQEFFETVKNTPTKYDNVIHELHTGEHFSKMYAAYRPQYPQEIYDKIMAYHSENPNNERELAVDVGCGTGQGTLPLTKYFKKVIGTDVSEDQINNMPKNVPNLESHVSFAEDLKFLKDGSVDLVTIATALHWVDQPKFLKEVTRVLKPGGTFATYTFNGDIIDNVEWQTYFYELTKTLFINYVTSKVCVVYDKYKSLDFPFKEMKRYEGIKYTKEMTVDEFMGYVSSFHCVNMYILDNQDSDILDEMKQKLISTHKTQTDVDQPIKVKANSDIVLILGTNN